MAREERSAGVVLFRADPAAPDARVFLLLDYGRYWDYPKGHVEKGEDELTAALRELHEETGITDAQVVGDFRHEITYFFRHRSKGLIRKKVTFFLASTRSTEVKLSHEHVGFAFLPFREALERVQYPNAKDTLKSAHEYLTRMAI